VPVAFSPSAWKVAKLLQDLHQDDGDKHAYGDSARLHRGKDLGALYHEVSQALVGHSAIAP
jgi:hypothetical protein